MDSSWHGSKCSGGPMWQSSSTTAAAASPSCQLQSQDSQNQMQNAGHTSYLYAVEDPNSSICKVMLEPAFTVTSTSGFYNLAAPEQRSSFLSLLSGPPPLLQNDPQRPLIPDYSSSFRFGPPRTGASLAPSVPIMQNPVNHCLKLGVDTCSGVSSKMVASAGRRSSSCLHKALKAANVNGQSSGHAKLVNHKVFCGIEQGKGFPSLRAGPCSTPSPTHISKVHSAVPQTSQRVLQANSFSHRQSSHFTSGCPRVFCLHASGTLLLSSTGLLGVVCSCHGLHMSISQFSEHSGLLDVNPGDAVHMDSGETIAQWIKVYFHKFRIRIQEDHHGWDWPEGFSGAAGLVKSKGSVPNTFQSENLLNVVGPSGAFLSPGEPKTNGVFSNELNTGQKLVNEVMRKNQGNAQDSCNSFNRFIGTSQNNVQTVAANQITEHSMLECSPMPKFVSGQDNAFQASSTYFGSISKSENSFVSLGNIKKAKSPGKRSDPVNFNNLRRGDIQDRTAVSSNFELRLGQPSQQNQTSVSNVPASGTRLISSKDHPPKSLLETLTHKPGSAQVMDESRQYVNNVAHTAGSKTTIEQSKINFLKHAPESHTVKDAVRAEQFHNAAARSSAISTFLAHLESPSTGKLQCNASSNMYNGNHVMPKQQLCESLNAAKRDPISLLCMKGVAIETKSNIYEMGVPKKNMEKDKGTHAASGAHEMNLWHPTKSVGTLISSYGFGAASHDTCLTTCEKSSHFHKLSDMPADSSDGRIPFGNPEKMSTHGRSGYYDHGFLRSVSSLPMDSGPTLPSQSFSVGFSSMASISVPSRAIMSANNKGIVIDPCFEDKKLQMLAARKVVEYPNQDQLSTSVGMNQDLRRAYNYFSNKVKSSIAIPSKLTKSRDETLHGNEDAAEFAMKSVDSSTTHWMEGASGKSANVSGASQEAAWRLEDTETHCQELHTPNPTKKPSIRPGGGENNIGPSCEHVNCCQRVPYPSVPDKCSCAASENCLDRNCKSIGKPPLHALREGDGNVSSRTSTLLTSHSDKDCTIPENIAISVGQVGEFVKPNVKQVEGNAFQWKDVPCKVTAMGKITCKDRPAELLGERKNVEDQFSDLHTKCFSGSAQGAEEQKISYFSSKCSAPAITQTSTKVSIEDSCTNYARDSKCGNNHVVDEASGIEKCWSSDDAPDSGENTQFDSYSCERDLIDEGTSEAFPDRSSRSLIDELRLRDSLTMRKVQKEVHSGLTVQKYTDDIKSGKRKRAMKWKRLNASFYSPAKSSVGENLQFTGSSDRDSYNLVGAHVLIQPSQGRSHSCACSIGPSFKKRRSTLSSSNTIGCKRSLHRCYSREGDIDCQRPKRACDDCITTPKFSCEKRFRSTTQVWKQGHCTDAGITMKCNSVSCGLVYSTKQVNVHKSITKPIVSGMYGIISNGNTSKPVKILSIGKILKNTRKCTLGEDNALKLSPLKSSKNTRKQESNQRTDRILSVKVERNRGGQCAATCSELDHGNCVEVMEMACSPCCKKDDNVSHMVEGRDVRYEKSYHVPPSRPTASLEPKIKDDRKHSLYELTTKDRDNSLFCGIFSSGETSNHKPSELSGKYARWASVSGMKHADFEFQEKFRTSEKLLKNAEVGHNHVGAISSTERSTGQQRSKSSPHLAAYCCVCGNSSNEKVNCLLECNRCLIKVHQACYGISTVPKTHWHCRPCRTGSQNIVCVLCGYGGGAMTRALRSDHMVKCLTNTWNRVIEANPDNRVSPSEALGDPLSMKASRSQFDSDAPSIIGPLVTAWKKDLQMESQPANNSTCPTSYTMVQNSISAGVFDSTVKQWVHMVCGLWTPETRCPNVDTMSAFDVSGVSLPKGNLVCSICKCPGGSCIKCRVMDCPTRFHPWCAHHKGLLQSEVEGADNEKVGFYGRCEFHDTQPECSYEYDTDSGNTKCDLDERELTCARTEGYKGRKRDCLRHNIRRPSNGTAGGLVPQEQLNAWIHINGQKPYTKGFPNLPVGRASDIETDCRKEYARYKQLRGWKHLVVYKSGIHALGLYTSSFILRGAMVVEYVGEIVGLRVADRREGDYQSGKKLQYKSACYFFRIDKEHIIDATHKGGIARFVNHSCLPNCIAKVITVRNEKKVVFFAERDIYPGEEITYDYHFNHEDEGKKIPCLCNAKNCRRYLN